MKVLMAVEDLIFSEGVVRLLADQLIPEKTEVMVLHVLQPAIPMSPPEMALGYAPELQELKEPARQLVSEIGSELQSLGFTAHTDVRIGDVTQTIVDAAWGWNADLIVVGSHRQTGLQNFLLGSVAESVARKAKCSVQIVRKPVTE